MGYDAQKNVDITTLVRTFLKEQPVYIDETGQAWLWNYKESRWRKADDSEIINAVRETDLCADKNYYHHNRHKVLATIKDISKLPEFRAKEPPYYLVQFDTKIYDIRKDNDTGQDATSAYFFPNVIPHKPSASSKTPVIDNFLIEAVGEKYLQTAKEILMYCVCPYYPLQKVFIIHGTGGNGKGEYLKIATKFLGKENITEANLDSLEHDKFATGDLHGKLAVFCPETNFSKINDTQTIKKMTGDMMSFESKGKNRVVAPAKAKVIISSNQLPISADQSNGFMRRTLILDFIKDFQGKGDIKSFADTIPDYEYERFAKFTLMMLPGLLRRGTFTNELTVEQNRYEYNRRANPLPEFIEKCCVVNEESWTRYSLFHTKITSYFKKLNKNVLDRRQIIRLLQELGYEITNMSTGNGIQPCIIGLAVKDDDVIETVIEEYIGK